ncbi:GTP cyclohydrolase II [Nocardia sp. NBC_00403]|uniref:GTP cyclohydrolase II n=1 Tax=Nocardia sp. NBC_00403 TaxID=2975990 RepID=UPI002E20E638
MEVAGGAEYGYVLVFGELTDGCLVRVHSRCLYGDALGSDDCDCGPELDKALDLIQAAGAGVLVYLEQEGRGVGLIAKARGYQQSERTGSDTFASYEALGYPADARTYNHAAKSLVQLGLRSVQLLTNNPAKAEDFRLAGLTVTVIPLRTRPLSARAAAYLEAKRRRRRHWIPTDDAPWAPADWESDALGTFPAVQRPRRSRRLRGVRKSRLVFWRRTSAAAAEEPSHDPAPLPGAMPSEAVAYLPAEPGLSAPATQPAVDNAAQHIGYEVPQRAAVPA